MANAEGFVTVAEVERLLKEQKKQILQLVKIGLQAGKKKQYRV